MKRRKLMLVLLAIVVALSVSSCRVPLETENICYWSLRTKEHKPITAPDDASIYVFYFINEKKEIRVCIKNLTDEIMIVDQTRSFYKSPIGTTSSYYDPTVRSNTTTDFSSSTKGATINAGAVAGAFGVSGVAKSLLNGLNLGGSSTSGSSTSSTVYTADQPQIIIAPHSSRSLSQKFYVYDLYDIGNNVIIPVDESKCKFSVYISYSLDNGATYNKVVTDMYLNSRMCVPVTKRGALNDALRQLYHSKPDALNEDWWMLRFNEYQDGSTKISGFLYDYQ